MQEAVFWMVWRKDGNAPTHQHSSLGLAQKEAERLARQNPGATFYVLAAKESRCVDNMRRVELVEELPF